METLIDQILFIGAGIALSLQLLLLSIACGLILGILLAVLRYNNLCTAAIQIFISVIRGTPVILQLGVIYFSLPELTGLRLNLLSAGVLTFSLNSSAYIAEIVRAGVNSLPKGQFEAAQALQIPALYQWKDIILPQVVRNILPSLFNEAITLLKETALISTIGGMDLMLRARTVAAEQFTYFVPLFIAGCYYYLLVFMMERLCRAIERRKKYHVKRS